MSDVSGLNGIINIYKEEGYTSFDVIAILRGITGTGKCGHTGTLDPMATGVLPVAFGKATKVCSLITDWDKEYEAEMLLGRTTDTLDITGTTISEREVSVSESEIKKAIMKYLGGYDQMPPMYSALKVDGKRLYDIARSGGEVERTPRRVSIPRIEILSIDIPDVRFKVLCSKGTYIRSLCDDIGYDLGCGACMKSLVRTKVGPYAIVDAVKISELESFAQENGKEAIASSKYINSTDSVFYDLPAVKVKENAVSALENGNKLKRSDVEGFAAARSDMGSDDKDNRDRIRVYFPNGAFAAVYMKAEGGLYKPEKMFI